MSNPVRHANHILESKSKRFLESNLPNEWVFNVPSSDYGIDYNIDIVINNQVTGLNFSIQLKGTASNKKIDHAKVSLKHSTLSFYNGRLEPVMLIQFIEQENEAYWIWVDELNIDLSIESKTHTISIPKTRKLSEISWEEITNYVQNNFYKRTFIGPFKISSLDGTDLLTWRTYYDQDYKQAVYLFRELLKQNPANNPAKQALAWSLYMSYDYGEALRTINELLEIIKSPSLYEMKACILAEHGFKEKDKGKIIQARDLFKNYIDNNSESIIFYNYANTLNGLQDYEEAIIQYKISLTKNPNHAECWKNLGTTYWNIKQHDEEMVCYDKALSINPELKEALISKGITLAQVYNQYEEALQLFNHALQKGNTIPHSFIHSLFWVAYTHEKLGNLDEALLWINKGMEYLPSDIYFLNFKSNLLAKNWQKHAPFIAAGIEFFKYRLELENDFKSLYYYIKIKGINQIEAYNLIYEKTSLFNNISIDILDKFPFDWDDVVSVLSTLESYRDFRNTYPLSRYVNNLISPHFSITNLFWDLLDLVYSISFNKALTIYNDTEQVETIPDEISKTITVKTPSLIEELVPDEKYPQEIALEIFSSLFISYFDMIMREIGLQVGYLLATKKLSIIDPEEYITKELNDNLSERIMICLNNKLNLLAN